jgi:hypothetical protein
LQKSLNARLATKSDPTIKREAEEPRGNTATSQRLIIDSEYPNVDGAHPD